jgi:hypothetical protein
MWLSNSYDGVMPILAVLRALGSCRNFYRYWDSVQTDGGRSIHYNKGRFLASYAIKVERRGLNRSCGILSVLFIRRWLYAAFAIRSSNP